MERLHIANNRPSGHARQWKRFGEILAEIRHPVAGSGQTPGIDLPEKNAGYSCPRRPLQWLQLPNSDDAPVELPPFKPIAIHAERDFEIGHMVGELLEQNHYLQTPVTAEMSQRWLKNYLLALDPTHLFFLQSDVDEFTTKYGNILGDLLLHGDSERCGRGPGF